MTTLPDSNAHITGFEWDAANRDKCQRHGISIGAIESLFAGPVTVLPDPAHSKAEARFQAIGKTSEGRYAFIVFTLRLRRDGILIRPISARYMHLKEVRHYEKEIAKTEKR